MVYTHRIIEDKIKSGLQRGKSILLLGARQTGKTTLLKTQITNDCYITFADPEIRLQYEMSPQLLRARVNTIQPGDGRQIPLVILDEIQKVPVLMDAIQLLIDEKQAQFILTGSSARKLKRDHDDINLLPGRVIRLQLDPLCLSEMPQIPELERMLIDGSLPEIFFEPHASARQEDLQSYVITYLEEEVRAEAIVRNVGAFARFLECATLQLGEPLNFEKISQDVGVKRNTIIDYYEILIDCLIADRIEPITTSQSRHRLTKASKYLLFDLGVRRVCAREGVQLSEKTLGNIFEQFIGMELLRHLRLFTLNGKLRYWRDHNGPEVDFIIDINHQYLPIEAKFTRLPANDDIKHLQTFLQEYPCFDIGYIICRCPHRLKLTDRVIALPWQELPSLFKSSALE